MLLNCGDDIMVRYIKSDVHGKIAETGEPCIMRANGYWTDSRGRHITCYERVDVDVEYNDGVPVKRLYSMDRHHMFYAETEDEILY